RSLFPFSVYSFATFLLLPSFPTRRSSDLSLNRHFQTTAFYLPIRLASLCSRSRRLNLGFHHGHKTQGRKWCWHRLLKKGNHTWWTTTHNLEREVQWFRCCLAHRAPSTPRPT